MDMQGRLKRIRAYWEDPSTVSLIDTNLRRLEELLVLPYLKRWYQIADFGCGDGASTVAYAPHVKTCLGVETSQYLLKKAKIRFRNAGIHNVTLRNDSILQLDIPRGMFHLAITQRLLINLPSWDLQKQAITKIASTLHEGGYYIMIENTHEGHNELNALRKKCGLKAIPIHWHNTFFYYEKLVSFLKNFFVIERHHHFDLYYLLTRVYMNMFAEFEGWGKRARKDKVFALSDQAALKLSLLLQDTFRLNAKCGLGPIQGFILRKRTALPGPGSCTIDKKKK